MNIEKDKTRKNTIRAYMDRMAPQLDGWRARNRYYYGEHETFMRFLVKPGLRVLDLGCGAGHLLAALKPAHGVGVDLSERNVASARERYPALRFVCGDVEDEEVIRNLEGPFDVLILSDIIGFLTDCQNTLETLHQLCTADTRVIISYFSWLWEPPLRMAEKLGLKMPQVEMNWMSSEDIFNLLKMADFEPIKADWRILLPKYMWGVGPFLNKYLAPLPVIRRLCLRNYAIARSMRNVTREKLSTTVVVPCRNEQGNIEAAVQRTPLFCEDLEILFVEGNSRDDTYSAIQRVIAKYPDRDIKVLVQDGVGKGDAVRKGFAHARGQVLMILDGDLTMPPEDLPKFYEAIVSGKGEFVNGSRLVYPMEGQAMRFLNFWANRVFAVLFTWLLNQRYTDTLCGTKVLRRDAYRRIEANRSYFGDFDPFGDFDLIFGAAKLHLKTAEVPIRYASREYGETQISRFRHGWLLLKMVVFAFRKLKAFSWRDHEAGGGAARTRPAVES
ncbi:MAG: glycosyltransferase [Deltaproteobacteria bacterium]|nr:glycosyltransferase [Deltaproteobacteria bacterium]